MVNFSLWECRVYVLDGVSEIVLTNILCLDPYEAQNTMYNSL